MIDSLIGEPAGRNLRNPRSKVSRSRAFYGIPHLVDIDALLH